MSYLVMARKYRPSNFDMIVGQPHVVHTLKNALKSGRYAHAYIFSGPRGVGKTSTARILAKALNCEKGPTPQPCGECRACISISSGASLDVLEIDAASNRGIDEIRNLRENVRFAPAEGKFRVYIIDEIHMLTKEANNAFLKTLEEPPSHAVFIGATTEIEQVPRTVLSRVQRFNFRLVPQSEIAGYLKFIAEKEEIAATEEAIDLLAGRASGSLRDGVGLLDQLAAYSEGEITADEVRKALGVIDQNLFFRAVDTVVDKNSAAVFQLVEDLSGIGADPAEFMRGFARFYRDLLFIKSAGDAEAVEGVEDYRRRMTELAAGFNQLDLVRLMKLAYEGAYELRRSQTPVLGLELKLFAMMKLHDAPELSELLEGWASEPYKNSRPGPVVKPDLFETKSAAKDAAEAEETAPSEVIVQEKSEETNSDATAEIEFQNRQDEEQGASELSSATGIERIQATWGKVADTLRRHNHSLAVYLRDAAPTAIKRNQLEVACGGDFQMKCINGKKRLVQDAIKEATGMSLLLKCYRDDEITKSAAKTVAPGSQKKELNQLMEENGVLKELHQRFDVEKA